ncbi:MAG: hypothetical protein HYU77_03135 [Betaproteobacteria bacterium]|nr:hypothetical protein [Betaproteobacteria bacterium]
MSADSAVSAAKLAVVATAVLLQACAALEVSGPAVSAPTLRAGDAWTYQEYDGYSGRPTRAVRYQVREVSPDTVIMELERDGVRERARFAPDWNPFSGSLPNNGAVDFTPAYPALVFPLQVGKTWISSTGARVRATGRTVTAKIFARVLGRERVVTPAGEFEAFRVQRQVYLDDREWWRSGTEILEFDWYAPDAKAVVKHEDRSEFRDLTRGPGVTLFDNDIIRGDRTRTILMSHKPADPSR